MSAPLIVPAVRRHTATVIFVHGLGDEGAGWIDLAENWRRRQKFSETKFIFPNAPSIPITLVRSSAFTSTTEADLDRMAACACQDGTTL